jgi:putative endonuclease
MLHYVYILRSLSDGRYYVGTTQNLEERLERHNQGRSKYTRNFRPWELVHFEEYPTRSEAMKREYAIKRRKSQEYIKAVVENPSA